MLLALDSALTNFGRACPALEEPLARLALDEASLFLLLSKLPRGTRLFYDERLTPEAEDAKELADALLTSSVFSLPPVSSMPINAIVCWIFSIPSICP